MKRKRLLSWVLTFAMIAGMFVVPASAEGNTTTITQDNPSGTMTITLEIPKKTPAASDLTYAAPSELTYSGSDKVATVAAASGVTGLGTITVKYYSDAARTTEATPKNVGTYYVGATVAEGDNYTAGADVLYGDDWSFAITKSTPSAPAAPKAASTAAKSITLTTVDDCEYSKDNANWQDSPTFTGLTPSTEYTFYQRIKETANNNASPASSASFTTAADTYAMTITLVIKSKDPATVTKAPTAKTGLTFNGGDQPLVNEGTASGGTMQYALGTESAATGEYGAAIPTGKAVGTYYVWYKAAGDAEHSDSNPACVTVTIGTTSLTAQGVTIYAIPDQNSTGEQIKPKPVVKHLGYLLKEDVDYTLSYGTNTEIGTEKGTVTITGKGGYNGTLEKKFNIILPAYSGTLTVTKPSDYTYGAVLGNRPSVTAKDKSTDADMSLSGERVTVYYATTPSGNGTAWDSSAKLNAGTYYVWAELAATGTHDKATSARVEFKVNKAIPDAPSGVLAAAGYQNTYKVTLTIPSGKSYADYQYSTDNSTWTALPALKDGAFTPTGLSSNSSYTIHLRTKEDSNNNASTAATATLQTPAKVLLRYDANGSTASVPASVEYDSGATVTAAAAISRAGYTFAGWNEAANGGGTAHAASSTFSITANTTLYAQWTPITYSVDYHENGGNACTDETGKAYNAEITLPTPTYAEHTFNGWATVSGGSPVYRGGQKVSGLTTTNDATVELYAIWTENTYQVTGEVKEELDGTTEQSIVAGVTVKIMRGNVQFGDTKTTDENGEYTFSGVPAGTYNIVATRTVDSKTQTMTALVEVKSDQKVDPIVLPPSKINSVLSVTGDSTPPIMVGGLEEVAKDEAESTKDVTVTMTVKKEDESTATGEVKQQIEEIKEAVAADTSTGSGNTELEVLDVSVKKETKESSGGGNTTIENITETSQVVEIIVSFNMNGRFGFSLYRHHDGKAEPFQSRSSRFTTKSSFMDGYFFADKTAGLFYIYTSRFSTYAIGYEEGTSYTVTVNSGTGGGDYAEGAAVTITANAAPSGQVFDKWTTSDDVTFANASSATTTFTMPAKAVTVTATYRNTPSGGNTNTITVPVSGDSGSVSVSASVSGTTATVKAPTTAELNKVIGESVKTGGVTIDVSGLNKNIVTVSIQTEAVKAIEKAVSDPDNDASALTVKLTDGSVTFDAAALAAITDQAKGGTIQLNLDGIAESGLRTAQKTAIKDMDVQAVYDAYLTSNGQRISDFKGGKATVTVSYTLKDGQIGRGVVVWHVADDGKTAEVPTAYNDKTVSFTVEHFSNYVIAYDAERAAVCPQDSTCPISAFTDADPTAWYHDGVHYVLENGIMNGVGGGQFAPNGTTSRAMVTQILWNMESKPVVNYAMSYTDVDSEAWYTEAVRWATSEKIMEGYGGSEAGSFGPNDAITREQLVTILYRYAKRKGVDVSVGEDTNILSYDDALTVSEFAIPAMQWAVGSGAVGGRTNTTLNPKDTATRAEIATIIMRYCTEIAK